jgi:DNA repair/transcription protein MET18/MMS19
VKTIYAEEDASNTPSEEIQGLAKDASEECIQILKEPEKSQARAATKILCTFMTTTRTHSSVP